MAGNAPRPWRVPDTLSGCLAPATRATASGRLPEALVEEVVASRERGWYHTRGEGSDGADALAVSGLLSDEPIAIAISGPTDRFSANRDEYIAALRAEAARLFPNDA
ncbi:hypothetical protein FOC01_17860 [Bordetella bronchiseptica]|nr:hypothetical protein FOC01_17860 [Bordetella bronchiseptica]